MNYTTIYNNLIQRAASRLLDGYKERHHIIPRCLGGNDTKENLVDLTPEEHYIAHLLLIKIYPNNNSLIHAAVMMTVKGKDQVRNNKLYGWVRRKHSLAISKNQSSKGNSQFGKYWICNVSTNEVVRTTSKEVPAGWIRGKTGFTTCEVCGKNSGSKQRRFCSEHRPKSIAPKTTMSKGSPTALKLSAYCKARTKEEHPQYGLRWVNNGTINKMIPKDQVNTFLGDGWIKGKLSRLS
jgi:hypothetical protein